MQYLLNRLAPAWDAPAFREAVVRVAIDTDDLEAWQNWQRTLAPEGIQLDRLLAAPAALPAWTDVYVLHMRLSVGSQLARLRQLREVVPLLPVVVWCANLRELDQVLALEMGADDVVDAGLGSPVLGAKLRALRRRSHRAAGDGSAPGELRFGKLLLQRPGRRVVLGTAELPLTEGEFDVLWLLASQAGTTVLREDILRQVRGLELQTQDRSIDSRIYRLRRKLVAIDRSLQCIRTVRNRGYMFTPAA